MSTREIPILFSAPMIRAILAATKTQTRRETKGVKPRWSVGDLLWVKETFRQSGNTTIYRADGGDEAKHFRPWRPSIFMPRTLSRISLRVLDVRCEPLWSISEADARAEGVASVAEYRALWEEINGRESWEGAPTVWVISFERVS